MNVLVTGAAGFLGSHLCDALLARGHSVVGVDNFFRGKPGNIPEHDAFTFYQRDLSTDGVTDIARGHDIDQIYHYAAINGTKYFYDIPWQVLDDNVRMTQHVLDACREHGCRIVYASSSEVYGEPEVVPIPESHPIVLYPESDRDSYSCSKALGEFYVRLAARRYGFDYLILRIFNTYGPRMDDSEYGQVVPEFIRKIRNNNFSIIGSGEETRAFCYVSDHVDMVLSLVDHDVTGETVNVGTEDEVTINHLAKALHDVMDVSFDPAHTEMRDDERDRRCPDTTKLKTLTGAKPSVSLKEGLLKTVPYYMGDDYEKAA